MSSTQMNEGIEYINSLNGNKFMFIGPYQKHHLLDLDDQKLVNDLYKIYNVDNYGIVDKLVCSHLEQITEVMAFLEIMELWSPINNLENSGYMMGKEIYNELLALSHLYDISGFVTLDTFWLFLFRTEKLNCEYEVTCYNKLSNSKKIELQAKFNKILYELQIHKESNDVLQIIMVIKSKDYKITREEYTIIVSLFVNRRLHQPIYQNYVKSLRRIDKKKREVTDLVQKAEDNINQDLYLLRSGKEVKHHH